MQLGRCRGARKKEARCGYGLLPTVPAVGYSKWVEFPLRLIRCIGKTGGALHAKRDVIAMENWMYQRSTQPVGAISGAGGPRSWGELTDPTLHGRTVLTLGFLYLDNITIVNGCGI